jgi:hypothetical protein
MEKQQVPWCQIPHLNLGVIVPKHSFMMLVSQKSSLVSKPSVLLRSAGHSPESSSVLTRTNHFKHQELCYRIHRYILDCIRLCEVYYLANVDCLRRLHPVYALSHNRHSLEYHTQVPCCKGGRHK